MPPASPFRLAVLGVPAAACALASVCAAQQLIGYVPKRAADVTGWSDEVDGQAVLTGSSSVTTKSQAAPIKLSRGGTVQVCPTSELKLTASRDVTVAPPLLFSLDHGGIQIETNATSSDSIMTPDLRFTIRTSGPLDLRVRVARNGDTCVDNRGATAPSLAVSDAFGESMYEVPAGQHVLFQRGSVHQVVEHETAPCGCPETGASVAEALLAPGATKKAEPNNPASAQHPFPMPQAGEPAAAEQVSPAAASATPQVGEALSYSADMKDPDELTGGAAKPITVKTGATSQAQTSSVVANGRVAAAPMPSAPAVPTTAARTSAGPEPAKEPPSNDLVHVIGRAFKKLFGR